MKTTMWGSMLVALVACGGGKDDGGSTDGDGPTGPVECTDDVAGYLTVEDGTEYLLVDTLATANAVCPTILDYFVVVEVGADGEDAAAWADAPFFSSLQFGAGMSIDVAEGYTAEFPVLEQTGYIDMVGAVMPSLPALARADKIIVSTAATETLTLPALAAVDGDFEVRGSGLQALALGDFFVNGDLVITGNPFLETTGTTGPTGEVKNLQVGSNSMLADTSGLKGITKARTVDVAGVSGTVTLNSLAEVTKSIEIHEVGGFATPLLELAETVEIYDLATVTDLNGLGSLTQVVELNVNNNPALADITGLHGLTAATTMSFLGNPELCQAEMDAFLTATGLEAACGPGQCVGSQTCP